MRAIQHYFVRNMLQKKNKYDGIKSGEAKFIWLYLLINKRKYLTSIEQKVGFRCG